MNTNSAVKSRRHLISDVDFSTAQQALELAGLTMNPERSQRSSFKELMPEIYFFASSRVLIPKNNSFA